MRGGRVGEDDDEAVAARRARPRPVNPFLSVPNFPIAGAVALDWLGGPWNNDAISITSENSLTRINTITRSAFGKSGELSRNSGIWRSLSVVCMVQIQNMDTTTRY